MRTSGILHYIWGAHWRHLAKTIEPSVCVGDAVLCQIDLTACYYYRDCKRRACVTPDYSVKAVLSCSCLADDRPRCYFPFAGQTNIVVASCFSFA